MNATRTLDLLHELQLVDSGIQAIEAELGRLPRRLAEAEEDARVVEAQLEAARGELEEILKRRRSLESQIEDIAQTIVQFENQKLKVKTNEEFQALNHQIHHEKQRRSGLEDEVILSFDDEESVQEKIRHLEAKRDEVAKVVTARKEELERRSLQDQQRLEELRSRRESLTPEIESRLLARYETLRARKGGLAVVEVERGSCGGCHTTLPPQVVNEVRKRDALHVCEFCGRFLVQAPAA